MKKILAVVITVVMIASAMALFASAEGETLKIYVGDTETTATLIPSGVTVEQSDSGFIATTGASQDPWVSVELEGVDMSVYKFFTVTYRCDSEIGSNNTYMKTAGYIGAGDGGDWESNGMGGTADGKWHTKEYSMEGTGTDAGNNGFGTFKDQTITGIRLTCCGAEGGKFEVASIRFTKDHYEPDEGGNTNPGTADAAVIAIAAVACVALAGVVVAKKVK